jgi:hypothetical protein
MGTPTVVSMVDIHTNVPKILFTVAVFTQTVTPSPPPVTEEPSTPTPELTPVTTQPTIKIGVPTMENVPTLAGYNTPGIRVLEQPVAIIRDEIMYDC